uniref:hypothetical protein n=1 Tax=Actinosynnema sp. TaxID=1872144 RepID=UPI003F87AC65
MAAETQVGDIRVQGYDNNALAGMIDKIRSGNVASQFSSASSALRGLANDLENIDKTLASELKNLQIDWVGLAGDGAKRGVKVQAEG